jgi:hypothetical protein
MARLDDDAQEAISKMKEFMKMAQKKKMRPIKIIKEEGIKIPNVSNFKMKPFYDEYGKNVIYWYDKNSNYVMLLGKYSHQEIMDSYLNNIKKRHLDYMGIKKYNFFYLIGGPTIVAPVLKITTEIDGWRGDRTNHLYIYQLKPDVLFMNWKESPWEGEK